MSETREVVIKAEPAIIRFADGEKRIGKCPVCGQKIIVELQGKLSQVCSECGGNVQRFGTDPKFMTRSKVRGQMRFPREVLRASHNPDKVYGI